MENLRKQFKLHSKSDPTIIMTNETSKNFIAKLNMPIRYRRGGVVDTDSFLREKLFHETDLADEANHEASNETKRHFWEHKERKSLQ
jgi:hypothetical protein